MRRFSSVGFLAFFFSTAVLSLYASEPQPATAPVGLFFAKPEYGAPVIAPDGKHVAFFARSEGRTGLFILDLSSNQTQRLFDAGDGKVENIWWLGNHRVLFSIFGQARWSSFVQEIDAAQPRKVTALNGPDTQMTILPNDPVHVITTLFERGGGRRGMGQYVVRVDVDHDTVERLDPAGYDRPLLSAAGEVRADHGIELFDPEWNMKWRAKATDPWHELRGQGMKLPFMPVGMARDDHRIIGLARDQGDTIAVMALDPAAGARTLLAQRPDRDVSRLIWDESHRFVIGAQFYHYGPRDTAFFEPEDTAQQARIDQALPGTVNWLRSASADGQLQIVESVSPSCPPTFTLLDRQHDRITQLGRAAPALTPDRLGRTEGFQFKCADGSIAHGYVVLPPTRSSRGPAPLLVMSPTRLGDVVPSPDAYLAADQYLASRGYAVVHFALRGSPGFGRRFLQAGDFRHADLMPQDLEAGLRFLAESGWIDAKRVSLFSGARGGLLAFYLAGKSKAYRSVITVNTPRGVSAGDLRWMYADDPESAALMAQPAARKQADKLARMFDPDLTIPKLSVPVLMIYSKSFNLGTSIDDAGALRECFRGHYKTPEWYGVDFKRDQFASYDVDEQQLWTQVADFLDRTLK